MVKLCKINILSILKEFYLFRYIGCCYLKLIKNLIIFGMFFFWVWGVIVEFVRIVLLEIDWEKLFIFLKFILLNCNNSKYGLYKYFLF